MNITPAQVTELIRKRRSIFPKTYIDKPIPKEIIEEILENANWAPNHKLTEPWRFKVFRGAALQRLADYLAEWYKANTPAEKFLERKYEKNKKKPLRCACVIAICMQRDPEEAVPEWEELAAVSCAVHNMHLTCTAYDIGCYWSSPKSAIEGKSFFDLKEGESCLGLFYMGYHDATEVVRKRKPIEDKVEWIEY